MGLGALQWAWISKFYGVLTMPTYAKETTVSAAGSRAEIEHTLERFGASAFLYGWEGAGALIGFEISGRRYRISMQMPDRNDPRFTRTPSKKQLRSQDAAQTAWEQETRAYWRAMAVLIKGVLAAAEIGIVSVETALQSYVVLPNGLTAGEWLAPQIADAYRSGSMPAMLPMGEVK
jgi:hypothetical protein